LECLIVISYYHNFGALAIYMLLQDHEIVRFRANDALCCMTCLSIPMMLDSFWEA
jgi:hypothetical protein